MQLPTPFDYSRESYKNSPMCKAGDKGVEWKEGDPAHELVLTCLFSLPHFPSEVIPWVGPASRISILFPARRVLLFRNRKVSPKRKFPC